MRRLAVFCASAWSKWEAPRSSHSVQSRTMCQAAVSIEAATHAGDDRLLVHVQGPTTWIDDLHDRLRVARGDIGVRPTSSKSEMRAQGHEARGVRRVQLVDGLRCTKG